jgi:hypothetical protein
MIVIFKGHEAERLQYAVGHPPHGTKDFRHAVHRPGLGLEGHFDEIARPQRLSHAEQSARDGDGLEFCFCTTAVLKSDRSQDGVS